MYVCGNAVSSKYTGPIFPTAFANIMSLCHILVILAIFQNVSLLLFVILIYDQCILMLRSQMIVSILLAIYY